MTEQEQGRTAKLWEAGQSCGGWGLARRPPRRAAHRALPLGLPHGLHGPKGTDGSAQAWAVAVTRLMSYEQAEGVAAQGGGAAKTIAQRPRDNGGHVPRGQQSFVA